jgi:hypothetical protein
MAGFFYWFGIASFGICVTWGVLSLAFVGAQAIMQKLGLWREFMRATWYMVKIRKRNRERSSPAS